MSPSYRASFVNIPEALLSTMVGLLPYSGGLRSLSTDPYAQTIQDWT